MYKSLFLDRDGVINKDFDYVCKSEQIQFIDGIFDLCRYAKQKDYSIFVITNQAGIGRGFYSERDFIRLTKWMSDIFRIEGCPIQRFFYCPYHPVHGLGKYKLDSNFRKPNPGMIEKAQRKYKLDLANAILIGDKRTDIEAGLRGGIPVNLLLSSEKEDSFFDSGVYYIQNLEQAHSFIL